MKTESVCSMVGFWIKYILLSFAKKGGSVTITMAAEFSDSKGRGHQIWKMWTVALIEILMEIQMYIQGVP